MLRSLIFSVYLLIISFNVLAEQTYFVKNIKTFASDKTLSLAKNKAVEQGQVKAFSALVKSHFPAALGKINLKNYNKIEELVDGFELIDEKMSQQDYQAKISVRFNKQQVDEYMEDLGANFVEKKISVKPNTNPGTTPNIALEQKTQHKQAVPPKPQATLIIPAIVVNNQKILWLEDSKDWYQSIDNKIKNIHERNFVLPISDLEDISILNQSDNIQDNEDIIEFFDKYEVDDILVLMLHTENSNPVLLEIFILNKDINSWKVKYIKFNSKETNKVNDFIDQAFSNSILNTISNNKLNFDFTKTEIKRYELVLTANKLADWVNFENILDKSPYITNFSLQEMKNKKYYLIIDANITIENLKNFFEGYDYMIEQQEVSKIFITKASLATEQK